MMPDWLSLIDVAFLGVGLLFAWGGLQKGFAGQVAHLLTYLILGGLLFAAYPRIFSYLGRIFRSLEETYLMWLILAGLLIVMILIHKLISKGLAGVLKTGISDSADRGWGFVLGLARGLLVALFAMIFLVMLESSGHMFDKFRAKSQVGKMVCYELVPRVQPHLSRAVLEKKVGEWRNILLEQEEAGQLE